MIGENKNKRIRERESARKKLQKISTNRNNTTSENARLKRQIFFTSDEWRKKMHARCSMWITKNRCGKCDGWYSKSTKRCPECKIRLRRMPRSVQAKKVLEDLSIIRRVD